MMDYYSGGYLLLHCLPVEFSDSPLHGKRLMTCSTCFNESLLSAWSYAWQGSEKDIPWDANTTLYEHLESMFSIDSATREHIRHWTNEQFNQENVGWESIFMDAATAIDYKRTFFTDVDNCYLLALYLRDRDVPEFSQYPHHDGVAAMLVRQKPEQPTVNEKLLGYDIIGLEIGGQFHTSHCHNLNDELHHRFGLKLNQYGLYDAIPDWQPVVDYMNDDRTGCKPVPWGIAKIKQVIF